MRIYFMGCMLYDGNENENEDKSKWEYGIAIGPHDHHIHVQPHHNTPLRNVLRRPYPYQYVRVVVTNSASKATMHMSLLSIYHPSSSRAE